MLDYSIIDTKSQYVDFETLQDYPPESVDDFEIIITARHHGFQFINVGFAIADNGDWIPDHTFIGQPTPLTKPQFDVLRLMFYPASYTTDGHLNVAHICYVYDGLYTPQDIRDAIHWLAISGAIRKCDSKTIWSGLYDLSEVIRQSELFLRQLQNPQPQAVPHYLYDKKES